MNCTSCVLVDLGVTDENNYDSIIAYHSCVNARPNDIIIADSATSVNASTTFISEDGETVARQVKQIQRLLSEEEVAQIIIAYQGGTSANELAREYGCNRKAICSHLKKHGIVVTRKRIRSQEEVQHIIKLYEEGSIIEDIAMRHNVSQATISRLLHENGVRVRNRWDYD